MREATITRKQLVDAVEAGILASGGELSDSEKLMLRHVAQTECRVARGAFEHYLPQGQVCGCPLTLAGLRGEAEKRTLGKFWGTFDSVTYGHVDPGGSLWSSVDILNVSG